jgi:hypothetical protein
MRTPLSAAFLVVVASSQVMAQAISVPPRPSRPPPRSPSGCCAYYDGLVAYDYATGPAVQVAGTLAPTAPPPPREESPGSLPGGGMAWVPGYWVWNGSEFLWDAGRWMPIPAGATTWVPGRWESRTDGYAWIAGRWK